MDNIDNLISDILGKIELADDLIVLDEIRVAALGKKGILTEQMKSLGAMSADERKIAGQALNVAKEKIERCKKIMIVESEKSCLQAYSYFGEDTFVVAVCGSNLTRTQIKMINELQVEEVMIIKS